MNWTLPITVNFTLTNDVVRKPNFKKSDETLHGEPSDENFRESIGTCERAKNQKQKTKTRQNKC
jgi:hypothetical protein